MARGDFYNQSDVAVVMDGSEDVGHMEGDSVRLIPAGGAAAIDNGYDGATTSFSSVQSGTFEQDFSQTSESIDKYELLWALQSTGRGRLFNGMYSTATGAKYNLLGCSILSTGTAASGAAKGSGQTVVLNVTKIVPLG